MPKTARSQPPERSGDPPEDEGRQRREVKRQRRRIQAEDCAARRRVESGREAAHALRNRDRENLGGELALLGEAEPTMRRVTEKWLPKKPLDRVSGTNEVEILLTACIEEELLRAEFSLRVPDEHRRGKDDRHAAEALSVEAAGLHEAGENDPAEQQQYDDPRGRILQRGGVKRGRARHCQPPAASFEEKPGREEREQHGKDRSGKRRAVASVKNHRRIECQQDRSDGADRWREETAAERVNDGDAHQSSHDRENSKRPRREAGEGEQCVGRHAVKKARVPRAHETVVP